MHFCKCCFQKKTRASVERGKWRISRQRGGCLNAGGASRGFPTDPRFKNQRTGHPRSCSASYGCGARFTRIGEELRRHPPNRSQARKEAAPRDRLVGIVTVAAIRKRTSIRIASDALCIEYCP